MPGMARTGLPAFCRLVTERGLARQHLTLLVVLLGSTMLMPAAAADPLGPDGNKLGNERLRPGVYPGAPVVDGPIEPTSPPFVLDWSVGLKGTYTSDTTGSGFVTTLNPAFSAEHAGVRTDLRLDGQAELARTGDGRLALPSLELGASTTTRLDRDTNLTGRADLSITQDLRLTPGSNPQVLEAPQVINGSAEIGVDRSFGRFNVEATASLGRTAYGDSLRSDTGRTSNSARNVWEGDTRLRLGLQVTPILEVFGEAGLGRDWFDQQSPTSGLKSDATSTSLRAGIAGEWNGIWAASASVGLGHHDFDAAGLNDFATRLYDARVSFTPDPTIDLTASLSTRVTPTGADAVGAARVQHRAETELGYIVNSWLRLRASADWSQTNWEGSGQTEHRHGFGAGADYRFNARTALSADYGYAQRDNSATGQVESHTVSVGVTLRR